MLFFSWPLFEELSCAPNSWFNNCVSISITWSCLQAAGACWYLLGIQRAEKCLKEQCREISGCSLRILSCKNPIYYGATNPLRDRARLAWADNKRAKSTCLENADHYDYGAYSWTVQLVTNDSRLEKILFPIFWGLMTLRHSSPSPPNYY